MGKLRNLIGIKYDRLTVVERTDNDSVGHARWLCKCDCGNEVIVQSSNLITGNTKSCGCLFKERVSETHFVDLTSKVYERLTVIKRVENTEDNKTQWLCECDCGSTVIVLGTSLNNGNTRSCGCLRKEVISKLRTIHGLSTIPEYNNYKHMINRCTNTQSKYYNHYGGRGIKVCERWMNENDGFNNFLKDMGKRPFDDATIDRIDFNGDYEPNNCKWATRKEQARNKRSNIIKDLDEANEIRILYENGKSKQELADLYGCSVRTIRSIVLHETWN